MAQIDRFSVSLDVELLAAFDLHLASHGYKNRSEAVRDLIRDRLTSSRLQAGDEPTVAVVTAVCDHRESEIGLRLRNLLSQAPTLVVGSMHTPLDESRDMLAIALQGPADRVGTLADQIQAMRGVTHGQVLVVPIEA